MFCRNEPERWRKVGRNIRRLWQQGRLRQIADPKPIVGLLRRLVQLVQGG
jgi:hypothetical protein